jgi:hypothetical protein
LHSKRQQSVLDQSQMIDDARRIAAKPMAVMPVDVANRDVVRKAHGLPSAASVAAAVTSGARGIVIEKNVPIPTKARGGSLPFDQMEVGDSFFVVRSATGANAAIKKAQEATKFKFTYRTVTEGGVKGVRIWRSA